MATWADAKSSSRNRVSIARPRGAPAHKCGRKKWVELWRTSHRQRETWGQRDRSGEHHEDAREGKVICPRTQGGQLHMLQVRPVRSALQRRDGGAQQCVSGCRGRLRFSPSASWQPQPVHGGPSESMLKSRWSRRSPGQPWVRLETPRSQASRRPFKILSL